MKLVYEMVLPSCPHPVSCSHQAARDSFREQLSMGTLSSRTGRAQELAGCSHARISDIPGSLAGARVGPTSMRTRDQRSTHMAHMWTHTAHPCSDMFCPPRDKGPGFKAISALRQHLHSQVGQDSGNFSFPPSLFSHQTFEAQESGLVPVLLLLPRSSFQGTPSLGSRSILQASRGALHPQPGGCKLPELSRSQAGPASTGAGSHSSPQPRSQASEEQTGATFSETRGRSEVFLPQEGGTAARALLQ